jgi:glycosyltransferase involved in cell wall biosynthesis
MKKIAYLLGSLNRGGTETLLLDVFRNAASNQLDAIGIYRKTGVLENDFLASGVKMQCLPTGKNILLYLVRLRHLLKSNNITLVHAQQPIDAFYGLLASILLRIKIVLTLHGYDFADSRMSLILLKFILKITSINIYVSDSQREYYTQKYKLNTIKQHTVYNGISFDKLHVESTIFRDASLNRTTNSNNLHLEYQLSTNTLLLASVGNFVPGRDQFTICKFLLHLNKNNVPFQFLFIGKKDLNEPERYDKCVNFVNDNQLSENVHFLGMRNDVPSILRQLDAFIYSTDHDTFGIAVVEAMASRIPVFVNDWVVMTEITEHGKLATLYKTKDEADLFRQFSLYLQQKELFVEKAKLASKVVVEKYNIQNHISNLKSIYSNLS